MSAATLAAGAPTPKSLASSEPIGVSSSSVPASTNCSAVIAAIVFDGSVRTASGVAPADGSGVFVDDTAVAAMLDGAVTVERGALRDSMAGDEHAPATRARVNQMIPCRVATLT